MRSLPLRKLPCRLPLRKPWPSSPSTSSRPVPLLLGLGAGLGAALLPCLSPASWVAASRLPSSLATAILAA